MTSVTEPCCGAEDQAETGGAELNAPAKQEFLFRCTSVPIARASTMNLAHCAKAGSSSPAPAPYKRGKLHHATPKVGLLDEPPQLARALVTGF